MALDQAALEGRVNELEDALAEIMDIWEQSLSKRDSKSAGAAMVRVARLVSLGRLDDGTTYEEVRSHSIRELRHQVIALDATVETARQMLRDWNPTPLADTLRAMEGDLEAKARLDKTPTLDLPDDAPEIDVLRALCGVQKLLASERAVQAVEQWEANYKHRIGSGRWCPECGFDLMQHEGDPRVFVGTVEEATAQREPEPQKEPNPDDA